MITCSLIHFIYNNKYIKKRVKTFLAIKKQKTIGSPYQYDVLTKNKGVIYQYYAYPGYYWLLQVYD